MIPLPAPKPEILARRAEIIAALQALVPGDGVIAEGIRLKPYETDGLAAYRQMPLAVVLPSTTEQVAAVLRYCHEQGIRVVPRGAGIYMLGATMVESDDRKPITARAMLDLLSALWAIHPGFAEAEILETGAHVRPAFSDNIPEVRRDGRVIRVNGAYRHGFLLAPHVARQVTALVREEELTACV
jgi:glycine/D-amino acid oxidase-like deaminating enzyme